MPKWWNIGFVSVLLVTVGALSAHEALKDPALTGEHDAVVANYKDEVNLEWEWSYEDKDCQIFDRCVFIEVQDTLRCKDQIKIFVYLSDKNDDWVDNSDTIIDSPRTSDTALVEIGVNRDDFEFFMVGDARCTTGLPTVEALL